MIGPALLRLADDTRRRAVIGDVRFRAARAPVVVVRLERNVQRRVALVAIAETPAARALAAAIVVGDRVILAVGRVVARADPSDERHLRSRRARALRAAAAVAEKAVD